MSAKFMFQLYMTLSVTKIMAGVKCAILMLRYLNVEQWGYTDATALNIWHSIVKYYTIA